MSHQIGKMKLKINRKIKIMEELRKAIKQNRLYDYIANHGYSMNKNILIDLLKEALFTAYEMDRKNEDLFYKKLLENIEENTSIFED